ncbi:MAG: hypothetical protein R8G66_19360 [Cytophagales bacterium]|nr:hypothetical protein [Cytophagales bacterium]
MTDFFDIVLIIHLTCAFTSIAAGAGAMIARKAKSNHRLYGETYTFLIIATAITAFVMMLIPDHENTTLLLLGLFSVYITLSGNRSLKFKVIFSKEKVPIWDWLLSLSLLPLGLYMLYYGLFLMRIGDSWGIVLMVFGLMALVLLVLDIRLFRSVEKPSFLWLEYHSAKMIGSYAGAITALTVSSMEVRLGLTAWFVPVILGLCCIVFWNLKIRKDPVSVFDH